MKPLLIFKNISTQELLQEYVWIIKSQRKYNNKRPEAGRPTGGV